MSRSLHPDWHAIAGDGAPVHIRGGGDAALPMVSRRPAAVIGIVLTSVIGFALAGGFDELLGQTATPAPKEHSITITAEGRVEPPSITVAPGDTLRFTNTNEVPQIITSADLLMPNGRPLYTATIFPSRNASVQISPSLYGGTYVYSSLTTTSVQGQVIVLGPSAPAASAPAIAAVSSSSLAISSVAISSATSEVATQTSSSAPAVVAAATTTNDAIVAPPTSSAAAVTSSIAPADIVRPAPSKPAPPPIIPISTDGTLMLSIPSNAESVTDTTHAAAPSQNGGNALPRNPYVIGSTLPHPSAPDSGPVFHSGASYPMQQPKTGPEIWIVGFTALAMFSLFTRRTLRRMA